MKQTPRVQQTIQRAERLAAGYGVDFIAPNICFSRLPLTPTGAGQVLEDLGVRDEVQARLKDILESPGYNAQGGPPP